MTLVGDPEDVLSTCLCTALPKEQLALPGEAWRGFCWLF